MSGIPAGGYSWDCVVSDWSGQFDCLPTCQSAERPAKYPPIKFGDYAIWFARKSYEHMAQQPALADAEIAPGARATKRW